MRHRGGAHRRREANGLLGLLLGLLLPTGAAALPPWSRILRQPEAWYASAEAREVTGSVIAYQLDSGGWPKNLDMTRPPAPGSRLAGATIDNRATTTQVWLLARVAAAQRGQTEVEAALRRGFDYLLAAQYANGGWPQYYPLRDGYHSHITYNDGAMIDVLTLLRTAAQGAPPFQILEGERRTAARAAVERGVACILRTQVRVDGRLTAWCAQHDRDTLQPAPARRFEPASLSGAESVGILRFLMSLPNPSPELVEAIEAGVAWLRAVRLEGWRVDRPALPSGLRDQVLVRDPESAVWARFYDVQMQRPIFAGRDGVVHETLAAVEEERRAGYAYYGTWGESLLQETYVRWREAQPRESSLP